MVRPRARGLCGARAGGAVPHGRQAVAVDRSRMCRVERVERELRGDGVDGDEDVL
jgi:hypothetical protein